MAISRTRKLYHRPEACKPPDGGIEFVCRCGRRWVYIPAFGTWRLVIYNAGMAPYPEVVHLA